MAGRLDEVIVEIADEHGWQELVARYDLLVVEDLKIANMLRRAKTKPDPDNPGQVLPSGARAKSGLHRSISDAGWVQFGSILRAKAEDAGRTWIEVDPRHTCDGCERFGHAAPENRNILRAGLALHAAHAA